MRIALSAGGRCLVPAPLEYLTSGCRLVIRNMADAAALIGLGLVIGLCLGFTAGVWLIREATCR